jgi:SRSO17 transposase
LSFAVPSSSASSEKRFQHYVDLLAGVLGHADRHEPLRLYTTGLLLPGERKSVEPMAARLDPRNVRSRHQSLHHLVADADWEDAAVLAAVRNYALPALAQQGPLQAWIVDDTGLPKKGQHSVGVAHQYCGQLGKQANCQVAVSLSVAHDQASLPIAYRLYLPKDWAEDPVRRQKTGVPPEIQFQTKPEIALEQIRQALAEDVPRGTVLCDTAYGNNFGFRSELAKLGLHYMVGIESNTTVWRAGPTPPAIPVWHGRGRPHRRLPRPGERQPVWVKGVGLVLAGVGLAHSNVACGQPWNAPLPVGAAARRASPSRAGRHGRAPSRGMAAHGVAGGRAGADQVLVEHAAQELVDAGLGGPS